MKNITITLDVETAAWLRVQAAEQNMSVSRFVGEMLSERMEHRRKYQQAMRDYFALPVLKLRADGEPLPTREDINDRSRFR